MTAFDEDLLLLISQIVFSKCHDLLEDPAALVVIEVFGGKALWIAA